MQEVEKKENESKKHRSKGKKKKHKKHHYTETSETGSSSEGEVESSGLIQPSAQIVMAKKPAVSLYKLSATSLHNFTLLQLSPLLYID